MNIWKQTNVWNSVRPFQILRPYTIDCLAFVEMRPWMHSQETKCNKHVGVFWSLNSRLVKKCLQCWTKMKQKSSQKSKHSKWRLLQNNKTLIQLPSTRLVMRPCGYQRLKLLLLDEKREKMTIFYYHRHLFDWSFFVRRVWIHMLLTAVMLQRTVLRFGEKFDQVNIWSPDLILFHFAFDIFQSEIR